MIIPEEDWTLDQMTNTIKHSCSHLLRLLN